MTSAQSPSIKRLSTPRDTLLAFEIIDKITKADIEDMARQVDAAFDAYETVDLLLIMSNFEGLEAGAVFDGPSLGVQARSVRHVRKYGVVGAPIVARAMIETFGHLSPVEARTFDLGQESEAWAWVDANGG